MGPVGRLFVLLILGALAAPGWAQDRGREATPDEERNAKVEQLRAEMTNHIHLQANDLMDEMVYSWKEAPPFAKPTKVVLADVIAPVSMGSGFEALVENHLADVLLKNPDANVQLAHCPACHAILVHSDKEGTIISKGVDNPKAMNKLREGSGAEYALYVDFEAEGTALVARARLTKLDDTMQIVHAKTLTTRTGAPALLRSPDKLVSARSAREEYVALLEQRGNWTIPVRLQVVAFYADQQGVEAPIPLYYLQVGAEYAISSARAWTGSLVVGASYFPGLVTGGMIQARGSRLITGTSASLTRPNLYLFVGAALGLLTGDYAAIVGDVSPPDPGDMEFGPLTTYIAFQGGMEFRLSNRLGASIFVETLPTLWSDDDALGNWLDLTFLDGTLGIFQINTIGAEVTFAF